MHWVYDRVTKITILVLEEKNISIGNVNWFMSGSATGLVLDLSSKLQLL